MKPGYAVLKHDSFEHTANTLFRAIISSRIEGIPCSLSVVCDFILFADVFLS